MLDRATRQVKLENSRHRGESYSRSTVVIPAGRQHKIALVETDLIDCDLDIGCGAGGAIFVASSFTDCLIRARRPFKDFSWQGCLIERCAFEGTFLGNEFGMSLRSSEVYQQAIYRLGDLAGKFSADFSKAKLHLCAFYGIDLVKTHLPGWPSFTLLIEGRRDRINQLRRLPWPPHMFLTLDRWDSDVERDGLVAFTLNAESCVEEWSMPLQSILDLRGSELVV